MELILWWVGTPVSLDLVVRTAATSSQTPDRRGSDRVTTCTTTVAPPHSLHPHSLHRYPWFRSHERTKAYPCVRTPPSHTRSSAGGTSSTPLTSCSVVWPARPRSFCAASTRPPLPPMLTAATSWSSSTPTRLP